MGYERLTATDASFLHIETAPRAPARRLAPPYLEAGPLRDGAVGCRSTSLRVVHRRAGCTRCPRLRQR